MSILFHRNQETFDVGFCSRSLNLLAHAQVIEVDIGSLCGGHGKCGADRVVLELKEQPKVNPPTAIELHQLSSEEINAGIRLACQCFPNEDHLSIRVGIQKGSDT